MPLLWDYRTRCRHETSSFEVSFRWRFEKVEEKGLNTKRSRSFQHEHGRKSTLALYKNPNLDNYEAHEACFIDLYLKECSETCRFLGTAQSSITEFFDTDLALLVVGAANHHHYLPS